MTVRQRLCSDGGRQKARLCRTVQVCGPSPQEHEILIAVLAQVGLRDPLRRGDSSARAPYRLPPIRSRGKPNCAPISPQCPAHSLVVLRAQPPISSPVHPLRLVAVAVQDARFPAQPLPDRVGLARGPVFVGLTLASVRQSGSTGNTRTCARRAAPPRADRNRQQDTATRSHQTRRPPKAHGAQSTRIA
jgi:hypothetical protein